jgi:cytidylate kinase
MALITITQSLGSGDADIAAKVAKELDLELFNDNKLKEIALEIGVQSDDLKLLDEKAPSFLDRFFSTKPAAYLEYMEAVIYEVSRRGQGVIFGHGSPILLHDFDCALHVFVHASDSKRMNNLMEQQSIDQKAAQSLIRKHDSHKKGFFRYAFNLEWKDPSLYDLYINIDKIGSESAIKLILTVANSEEVKACSLTALETMAQLSRKRKLRAKLLENHIDVSMINLDVPEENVVAVSGFTYSERDRNLINKILNADPDVSTVRSDVALMRHIGE